MALSNAERQARYRQRLKSLAAQAEMTELKADLLVGARGNLRQWRHYIAMFAGKRLSIRCNGSDITPEHVAMLRRGISSHEALLEQYDPEGRTKDGNVEIGDVPPDIEAAIWAARPVSYVLGSSGLAADLRLFASPSAAVTDAEAHPDRSVGWVGDDGWSIASQKPLDD